MALYRTRSAAVFGIDAHLIDVEVDMYASSQRDFITVGMPDTAVRESRERIKSALINSGFGYPNKAVTINLAPANVRKEGAGFDLPMAMGILGAMGTVTGTDQNLLPAGPLAPPKFGAHLATPFSGGGWRNEGVSDPLPAPPESPLTSVAHSVVR